MNHVDKDTVVIFLSIRCVHLVELVDRVSRWRVRAMPSLLLLGDRIDRALKIHRHQVLRPIQDLAFDIDLLLHML